MHFTQKCQVCCTFQSGNTFSIFFFLKLLYFAGQIWRNQFLNQYEIKIRTLIRQKNQSLKLIDIKISNMQKSIKIKVDFSGGLDLVFDGKKQITVQLQGSNKVSHLIEILANEHANSKKDMFYASEKIKPGILVLINQVDWQVGQRQDTELEAGDKVSLISTLHGG